MTDVFDRPERSRRILAIDGGGMRGALAIGILAELEATLRAKYRRTDLVLADYFDLIGGTSTGAIIAAGLALGKDTAFLRDVYHDLGPIIFRRGFRIPLFQSRFDPVHLEKALVSVLGDVTLGNAAWKTGFATVAKRVDRGSVWLLTNCPRAKYWERNPQHPNVKANKDYLLAQIVQASAAAPFYFDMVSLDVEEDRRGVFFDGVMTPHGNPALQLAMAALVPAYGMGWKAGSDKLMVVSVGTGQPRPEKPGWIDRPLLLAIWKAIHALTSLSYDASLFGIAVMQWLGESPQGWTINREIGDLAGTSPSDRPLWTFVRYDAPLESGWLKDHLGEEFSTPELARLARMDDDRTVPTLYSLGRRAGKALIRREHFRDVFDPDRLPPRRKRTQPGRTAGRSSALGAEPTPVARRARPTQRS
jgi:uncharacterized protein